jgi:hypothetical protein
LGQFSTTSQLIGHHPFPLGIDPHANSFWVSIWEPFLTPIGASWAIIYKYWGYFLLGNILNDNLKKIYIDGRGVGPKCMVSFVTTSVILWPLPTKKARILLCLDSL